MTMHLCRQHLRIWQPDSTTQSNGHGQRVPYTPSHWRPIALGILQHAAAWATAGHCALPVEVVACDVCAAERRP